MNDLPPDLPRLRILETWLAYTLARVRRQIEEAEQREGNGSAASPPGQPHRTGCWSAA
ncbi:hypothetical protein [Streptomyces sp. NPDC052012]|uniref:hypothetical protein n=1 Tax=Streptomyces sp. NPDC052012 TaxID=3155051 RepID=UPI00344F3F16